MFSGIFGAVAPSAPPTGEVEEQGAGPSSQADGEPAATRPAMSFDIWGVAAAVSKSVKERADELVKSVQETDWKTELSSFSKGVSEDTKTLTHKTAELVEQLPEVVEHLPEKAAAMASQLQSGTANRKSSGSGSGADPDQQPFALDNVGGALTQFGQSLFVGTKELIEQVRDGIEEEIAAATKENKRGGRSAKSSSAAAAAQKLASVRSKYSRFEAEVATMQRDSSTYIDEPDDEADFERFKSTFSMDSMRGPIDALLASNAFMAELHSRLVPAVVEDSEFWTRYFYRLGRLQQRDEQRSQIAQRAQDLSSQQEEELGWDDLDPDGAEAAPSQAPAGGARDGGGKAEGDLQGAGASVAAGSDVAAVTPKVDEQPAAGSGKHAEGAEKLAEAGSPQAAAGSASGVVAGAASEEAASGSSSPAAAGTMDLPAAKGSASAGTGERPATTVVLEPSGHPGEGQAGSSGRVSPAPGRAGARGRGGEPSNGGSNSSGVEVSEADAAGSAEADAAAAAETASESSVKADWLVVNEEGAGPGADKAAADTAGKDAQAGAKASASPGKGEGAEKGSAGGSGVGKEEGSEQEDGAGGSVAPGSAQQPKDGQKKQASKTQQPRAGGDDEEDLDWGNWD